jgi:hypothetical protein
MQNLRGGKWCDSRDPGAVTFEPDPAGTRLRWSWELQPKGVFKLMGPLIAHMGRRQEAEIWAGLKRYMESGTTHHRE